MKKSGHKTSCGRIAHRDHGQKSERMKFMRILSGCPEGAGKWRILVFAMLLHSKIRLPCPWDRGA